MGKLISDGRLKTLYDRWNLDGRYQMLMLAPCGEAPPAETFSFRDVLTRNLSTLLKAAGMTVFLSLVSFPLAIAIGIGVAIGRMYGPWIIAKPLGLYVEVLRGTPLMLQLFAIFFLLAENRPSTACNRGRDRRPWQSTTRRTNPKSTAPDYRPSPADKWKPLSHWACTAA